MALTEDLKLKVICMVISWMSNSGNKFVDGRVIGARLLVYVVMVNRCSM